MEDQSEMATGKFIYENGKRGNCASRYSPLPIPTHVVKVISFVYCITGFLGPKITQDYLQWWAFIRIDLEGE